MSPAGCLCIVRESYRSPSCLTTLLHFIVASPIFGRRRHDRRNGHRSTGETVESSKLDDTTDHSSDESVTVRQ